MRWIEPVISPSASEPSARTRARLAVGGDKHVAGMHEAGFDDLAERHARLLLLGRA